MGMALVVRSLTISARLGLDPPDSYLNVHKSSLAMLNFVFSILSVAKDLFVLQRCLFYFISIPKPLFGAVNVVQRFHPKTMLIKNRIHEFRILRVHLSVFSIIFLSVRKNSEYQSKNRLKFSVNETFDTYNNINHNNFD